MSDSKSPKDLPLDRQRGLPFKKEDRLKILTKEEDFIEKSYREKSKDCFLTFVRGLKIPSDKGPMVFESCMAAFQRKCFEDIAPDLLKLKKGDLPDCRRIWLERTKKAGKDSDIATILLWLLCFPDRPFYAQVGAANREQASIVKERMTSLLHLNPWLNDHVELVQWEARSLKKTKSRAYMATLDIMSSDIAGAHGGTPDLLVINELSHVNKWEFVENLMDNADGVPRGLVIIATNAGFVGTKAYNWRNNALDSDDWKVHIRRKPAPWHSRKILEDARRRNIPSRYYRLWQGKWVSGKGDALDEGDIHKCFCLDGPIMSPEPGWEYIGGLDLGVSHDHSALVILGVNKAERIIKVVWWKRWKPAPDEVDLLDVERTCRSISQLFNLRVLFYDPSEARLLAQRLRRTVPMKERKFTSPGELNLMADTLVQVVESGQLLCYDDEDDSLRRDFGKFYITERRTGRGYKLEATSDESGHADAGFALVIALPGAVQLLDTFGSLLPDADLTEEDESEFSREEVEEMPDELRDLYEMESADLSNFEETEELDMLE